MRAATPSPPVVAPPRLPARGFAVLPAAISAWAPSISPRVSAPTWRAPSRGLMCASIRLRSIASVEALIGRRRRPRIRPASASARYQSQSSATVMRFAPARAAPRDRSPWRRCPECPGGLSRLLRRHHPVAAEHGAPVPALRGAVLYDEALEAGRADPDAEAAELSIPEELFEPLTPTLKVSERRPSLCDLLPCDSNALGDFASICHHRPVGSGMEALEIGSWVNRRCSVVWS